MDTNQAEEHNSADKLQYWEKEWPSEEIDERKAEDVNFFNTKGKGKGKGNQLCYNCNQPGHRAFECPHPKREKGAGGKGEWSSKGGKGKGSKGVTGHPMDKVWNAIRAIKGKSGGKGKGFEGNCERCGKFGHKAKECRAPMPVREVEEEEKSEIDWACMIDEEAQELNAAEEEKQSQEDEFDIKGLSDRAKKQVEERKKKLSSNSVKSNSQKAAAVGRESNQSDAVAAGERKGLELKWRETIDGGYRVRFVMDSGAAKTIVPSDAIPGMKMRKSNGGSFRMANGNVIPNRGEAEVKGLFTEQSSNPVQHSSGRRDEATSSGD